MPCLFYSPEIMVAMLTSSRQDLISMIIERIFVELNFGRMLGKLLHTGFDRGRE